MDVEQNAFGFVHFSLQIPLECTCSAYLCPKLIETSVFLRKTDVSLCTMEPRVAQMGSKILFPMLQNAYSGPHFAYKAIVFFGWGAKCPWSHRL